MEELISGQIQSSILDFSCLSPRHLRGEMQEWKKWNQGGDYKCYLCEFKYEENNEIKNHLFLDIQSPLLVEQHLARNLSYSPVNTISFPFKTLAFQSFPNDDGNILGLF